MKTPACATCPSLAYQPKNALLAYHQSPKAHTEPNGPIETTTVEDCTVHHVPVHRLAATLEKL